MRVVYFQAQTTECDITPMMREIDPNCPIPQSLEGGDGNGCLWECVIDERKKEAVENRFPNVYLFTTEVDDDLYRPEYFVQWRFGEPPSISRVSHR